MKYTSTLFSAILSITFLAVSTIFTATSPLVVAQDNLSSQNQITILGGLDLGAYCAEVNGDDFRAVLTRDRNSSDDWFCERSSEIAHDAYTQMCKTQYPERNESVARATNQSDPYSWKCKDIWFGIEIPGSIGGIDIEQYAQCPEGYTAKLVEYNIYGWGCTDTRFINFANACERQYPIDSPQNNTGQLPGSVDTLPNSPEGVECQVGAKSNI